MQEVRRSYYFTSIIDFVQILIQKTENCSKGKQMDIIRPKLEVSIVFEWNLGPKDLI